MGCFNNELDSDLDDSIKKANFDRYNGSIAVCDDTGVVIIESQYHNQDFLDKLKHIEELEERWYECIDRKKSKTFETICIERSNRDSK